MKHAALLMMLEFAVRNAAGLVFALLLLLTARSFKEAKTEPAFLLRGAVAALSFGWIGVLLVLFVNHLRFPLFLDLMEGTVFQHFQRAAHFEAIYPAPSPEYVPLAYNVLYYLFAVPFSWVFGESLFTLRIVSVLATVGIGVLIFWILSRETGSRWWGLTGAGLFAASYRVMSCYLDTAHADTCFVLCSLAGSAIIRYNRSRGIRLLGLAILIASFWFKQHGALFAIGGLLYLTWDEGWRRSWPYWLLGFVLGPVAYLAIGPILFGSHFLYFTYTVPSGWSTLSLRSFARFGGLLVGSFFWLALTAIWWFFRQFHRNTSNSTIWQVQLAAAFGTALMGSLDEFSSNNVYIPFFTWLVLCGVWGFHQLNGVVAGRWRELVPLAMLVVSFALVAFNPLRVMTSRTAQRNYREFERFLEDLDGDVYAPTLGQLPTAYSFYPAAHWVALEDMVRGPGKDTRNHPLVQQLLAPLLNQERPVYILENYPLTQWPWFEYLNDYFVLQEDLTDRFRPLRVLPGRYDHKWPRYLYRFDPRGTGDDANSPDGAPASTSEPYRPTTSDDN